MDLMLSWASAGSSVELKETDLSNQSLDMSMTSKYVSDEDTHEAMSSTAALH